MAGNSAASIWSTMQYVPPRGQCNFKQSIMSAKCPCLRFMLHPLKSSSSYECDGCTHHASFHSMENRMEDEIRKRWEQEAREKQEREIALAARPKKRLRELEYRTGEEGMLTPERDAASETSTRGRTAGRGKGKTCAKRPTRSRGRVLEMEQDDEDYIELD